MICVGTIRHERVREYMKNKNIWIVSAVLIIISCWTASGIQTYGPEPLDKLPLVTNVSDLVVYGKTATNDVQWVNESIQTLNQVEIFEILKQKVLYILPSDHQCRFMLRVEELMIRFR